MTRPALARYARGRVGVGSIYPLSRHRVLGMWTAIAIVAALALAGLVAWLAGGVRRSAQGENAQKVDYDSPDPPTEPSPDGGDDRPDRDYWRGQHREGTDRE